MSCGKDRGRFCVLWVGGTQLAQYSYSTDGNNRLLALDYGNGDGIDYSYDDRGRVTRETYEDGAYVDYRYDNEGRLASTTDSETGITTTYYYDFTGRMMRYTQSGNGVSYSGGYSYDTKNNLTGFTQVVNGQSQNLSYTYDKDNRVVSFTNGTTTQTYTYDGFGRVSRKDVTNNGTTVKTDSYTYEDLRQGDIYTSSQVKTHTVTVGGTTTTYTYSYDRNGNITQVTDGTNTVNYTYDTQNQLLCEEKVGQYLHTWTYDEAGNILSRKEQTWTDGAWGEAVTVSYGYEEPEETETEQGTETDDWGDLLWTYDGNAYRYDEIGNPLSDGTWTYTWKHGRQLASMTDGETSWNYTYNADGLRTKRTDGTSTYSYVYNGSQLVQMKKDNDTLNFTYDAGGMPLTVTYNGTVYYYVTNQQGDITAILNTAGTAVVSYTYDAWGNPISDLPSTGIGALNPLRYRGYVYDTETGLYYVSSRYYDPEIGRFISPDTTDVLTATPMALTDKNLYAYCDNNPVIRADHGGDFWNVVIGAAVGAVVGVAGQFISDLATSALNGKWTFSNWQTYAGAAVGGAVGGAILGGTGHVGLANAASGFVTTGVGMSLEKVTGASDKSWAEIGVNAVADGAISYGLGKLPGVKNVTKGRNNMSAVYRSGLTKLRNKTVSHMSKKVIGKGLVSGFVGGLAMDGYYGVKQYGYN